MDVILLERVDKLGSIGDVVGVRSGYARNFLLPQGKALRANNANKIRFEADKESIIARNATLRADSEARADAIDGAIYTVIRQSGDTGRLYGSVTARDVARAAAEIDHEIDWREVRIERPIKDIGVHGIRLSLHPEVTTEILVNVARSTDEAERQAAGENVIESEMSGRAAQRFSMSRDQTDASRDQTDAQISDRDTGDAQISDGDTDAQISDGDTDAQISDGDTGDAQISDGDTEVAQ